jgi:uncharacterized membrane protein
MKCRKRRRWPYGAALSDAGDRPTEANVQAEIESYKLRVLKTSLSNEVEQTFKTVLSKSA